MPPVMFGECYVREAWASHSSHHGGGGRVLSARGHYNTVNAGPGLCLPQLWGDKHAGRGEKGAKPQGNSSLLLYLALTTVLKLIKVHGASCQRGMFDHYIQYRGLRTLWLSVV